MLGDTFIKNTLYDRLTPRVSQECGIERDRVGTGCLSRILIGGWCEATGREEVSHTFGLTKRSGRGCGKVLM